MSYDFEVWAHRRATGLELEQITKRDSSLALSGLNDSSGPLSLTRGTTPIQVMGVDRPYRVDIEDVPTEVMEALPNPQYLYELHASPASPADLAAAWAWTKGLADAVQGIAQDLQTGRKYPRKSRRLITRPRRFDRVDIVTMRWYWSSPGLAAQSYIDACIARMPEALPHLFGEFEPFQFNFTGQSDQFLELWDSYDGLDFKCNLPFLTGHLNKWQPRQKPEDDLGELALTLLGENIITDAAWRETLQHFFLDIATRGSAFYASAEIEKQWIWDGRTVRADARTKDSSTRLVRGEWLDLPSEPAPWSWYGAQLLRQTPKASTLVEERFMYGGLFRDVGFALVDAS